MTARAQAQCTPSCARYRSPFSPEGQAAGATEPFCQPFPQGIPDDIWENRFDHRQVHPDQVGDAVWTAAGPDITFPTYALAVTEDAASTLTAAADALDGAMIALVPSLADLQRLAIPGGESIDQLHLTLVYLGEAADIEPEIREELITWAREVAQSWTAVEGDGFAPAWFNPAGDEPCLTLVCSGPDLAEMHETVLADVSDSLDLPDQHQPWLAHITLLYSDVHEVRDVGARTAAGGGTDRGASSTAGAMSHHRADSVQASPFGLDSSEPSGQRDSGGGGSGGESLGSAGRGRSSLLSSPEVRGADSFAYRESGGAREASRGTADSEDMLEASGTLQRAQRSRLGGLRDVPARGNGEIPRATPGEGAGVPSERNWSGVATASGQEVSRDIDLQGAGGSATASKKGTLEIFERIADLTGPITFDRIRLAFGGEVTDIPLGSDDGPTLADSPKVAVEPEPGVAVEPSSVVAATSGPIREVWDGPLH